jgi:hypothetical protein
LTPAQRRQLALHALAGVPISQLADQYHVSRKFIYQQLDIAHDAVRQAFAAVPDEAEKVLFYLPITRSWIRQFVLALVLICHSPLRGVVELLSDLAVTVRAVLATQQMSEKDTRRWQRDAEERQQLAGRYYGLSEAVEELSAGVVRASSLVENVNSRLRSCFFLRRQVGPDYLELLRFFLNHRRLPRSEREARVGKSPAELLSGVAHKHWLEMLGYQRFHRVA